MNALPGRSGIVGVLLCLALCPTAGATEDPLYSLQRQWWQWAGSIPIEVSPLFDETGQRCDVGQRGPHWFLAGNFGGRTTRHCTVPKGVKLVIPAILAFCYPEEGWDTDASCIEWVSHALDGYGAGDITIWLDGKRQATSDICEFAVAPGDALPPIPDACVLRRRASRTLFNFHIGQSGFYASTTGVWRANAARGIWSVIDTAGLALGEHVIRIRVEGGPDTLIPFVAVTYRLTVARAEN